MYEGQFLHMLSLEGINNLLIPSLVIFKSDFASFSFGISLIISEVELLLYSWFGYVYFVEIIQFHHC